MNDTFRALLPLLLLALAFFVLIVLPMRTRSRMAMRTRQMQESLSVGTEIMTTSGLYGRIVSLGDQTIELEIAPGIVVRWARAAIGEVRSRSPADGRRDGVEETGGLAGGVGE